MVQIAGLGLGRTGLASESPQEVVDYFSFSPEILVIFLSAALLAILSCIGCFICQCCPFILPRKILNLRDRIHRSHEKPKKFLPRQQYSDEQELFSVNYCANSKSKFGNKRIPNIIISSANEQLATNLSEGEFTEIPLEEGKPEEIT